MYVFTREHMFYYIFTCAIYVCEPNILFNIINIFNLMFLKLYIDSSLCIGWSDVLNSVPDSI